ncbi:MAG: hypothetical protein MUF58_05145, partial [Arcicella sp.]|nr:hypothetical protein [Arcicella sp.]
MKNFTAVLLSVTESVISNSKQSLTVKKSEAGSSRNYRANLFKNIPTRIFLWGFYGIFSSLMKSFAGGTMSIQKVLRRSRRYQSYPNVVTGSRVYLNAGKASILSRSLIGVLVASLFLGSNTTTLAQCTGVAGTVFRDFNLNGKRDNANEIGLAGVTVRAFKPDNTQAGSTVTTAADGTYSITGATGNLRVEFSGLPSGYVSGPDGTGSGTSIQFVAANSCTVNFGVNHPDDFCAKEGVQPKVAIPCYANGRFDATGTNGAGLEDALVSFPYNRTGDKATSGNEPFVLSKYSSIGSVWGVAYNKYKKTLFTTAFMKRHSGFGPQGIAGLYVIQNADNNGSGYTITGINLQTALGINAGTQPTRNLQTNKTSPSDDGGNAVFNAVGKMSFGDCELSTDGNTLYITNLFDKKIYVLNVTNPTSPSLITSYSVPNPGCTGTNEYAPFGLKFYRGKLYVGVVCTAESSQPAVPGTGYGQAGYNTRLLSSANLKASVYEMTTTGTFTNVLPAFALNFDRGLANSSSVSYSIWRPWVSTWSQIPDNIAQTYPQPILSDIEFDTDGSMILGFADRFSHQLGNANYPPGETYVETGRVEGDVMRATQSGSTWTIENNGSASGRTTLGTNKGGGPGGGEYYFGDLTIDHDEPAMGGLAFFPGTGEIMTTIAGPGNIFYSGGTRRMNNNTGDYLYTGAPIAWNNVSGYRLGYNGRPAPTGDYKLYNGSDPGTFGKASGLGDIEVFCSLAPLEIGNRIWRDFDRDGIQDAGEPGITGITVQLYRAGTLVGTTATDANGEYYFNDANVTGGLLPNTGYEIRVTTAQTNLNNTYLSPQNANSNNSDSIDSDAAIPSGQSYASITLTTGGYGESNHTYDIGYSPNCPTLSTPGPNGGNVTICSGQTPTLNLVVSNAGSQPLPVTTTLEWVAFTSAQADPYTSGATKIVLTPNRNLVDGTVTVNLSGLPANTGTTPITYYIYVCLKPVPDANNPNCRPFVAYTVTVNPIPAAPSSVNGGSVCRTGATASVSMSATCATGTTPVWYSSTSSTTELATGNAYTATGLTTSTTFFVGCRATTAPNCETAGANRSAVTATVIATPAAPTISLASGSNTSYCGSGSATLNATACTTGSLTWSNGATTTSITVAATTTPVTYTATCTLTGCTSSVSNGIIISLNTIPSGPGSNVTPASRCGDGSVTLGAVCATGQTPQWYSNNTTAGTPLATGNTYTVNITATTTYFVACKDNTTNCETTPANRTPVTATENVLPVAPAVGAVQGGAVCVSGVVTLTATCETNQVPEWYSNNTTAGTPLFAGNTYTPSVSITTTYFVGCKNNTTGCQTVPSNRTPVVATVNPNPSAPASNQVVNGSRCEQGAVSMSATCSSGQIPQWYSTNTGNSLLFAGNTYTPNVTTSTTYYVGCKNTTTGCETDAANRTPVTATINTNPPAPTGTNVTPGSRCEAGVVSLSAVCASGQGRTAVIGTVNPNLPAPASNQVVGASICAPGGSVTLTATCGTGQTPQWYNNNTTVGSPLATGNSYTVNISSTTTYYVGC